MLNSKFRNKNAVIAVFFGVLSLFSVQSNANCEPCKKLRDDLTQKEKQLQILKDAEVKNNAYLSAHPDASQSILVKVKSNLIVIKLRTETAQNEKTFILSNLKKGCEQCQ